MERFELEYGTLTTLAMFAGRGMGYIKYLAPPERILRWVESKLNLLAILPHYVSVDQKTYGRFGVLPTSGQPLATSSNPPAAFLAANGSGQRLGS
ncbi:putative rhomboid protease [Ceratocystis pirilliformis]|uniref:Rhomboid protease n=1 Tax=Ceratocystis pirilliformis TaxID=259994 RepID=A0ABR3ZEG2_9PEZI